MRRYGCAVLFFGYCIVGWNAAIALWDAAYLHEALVPLWAAQVQGVVTSSDLEEDFDIEEVAGGEGGIQYAYDVEGLKYTSTQLFSNGFFSHALRTAAVEQHPPGTPVDVYYAPNDPAQAWLNLNWRESCIAGAIFLLPFNLIAVGALVLGWRELQAARHRLASPQSAPQPAIAERKRRRDRAWNWFFGIAIVGSHLGILLTFMLELPLMLSLAYLVIVFSIAVLAAWRASHRVTPQSSATDIQAPSPRGARGVYDIDR
jgi:hypothetical protein